MLSLSCDQIKKLISDIVWNFKVYDNIEYNLDILFEINHLRSQSPKPLLLNKLILIEIVSIIECVLLDFLDRLDTATNHFPDNIKFESRYEIKKNISKKIFERKGQKYLKIKNYNFSELVDFYQRFSLLGENISIYDNLREVSIIRNRVHIYNYHKVLERDEVEVYAADRVKKAEKLLETILTYFSSTYKRPFN